jgi:conserved oligomeric Golgi complex subunit 3
LLLSQSRLDTLLESITSTIELLSSLSRSLKAVTAETSGFQQRSQDILAEKQQLGRLIADLEENLQSCGYNDLKARMSSTSVSGQSARELEFSEALATLDKYLEYLKAR